MGSSCFHLSSGSRFLQYLVHLGSLHCSHSRRFGFSFHHCNSYLHFSFIKIHFLVWGFLADFWLCMFLVCSRISWWKYPSVRFIFSCYGFSIVVTWFAEEAFEVWLIHFEHFTVRFVNYSQTNLTWFFNLSPINPLLVPSWKPKSLRSSAPLSISTDRNLALIWAGPP